MKNNLKQLSPDTPEGGNGNNNSNSPVRSNIPRKDDDLLTVAQAASTKWSVTPGITLLWKTPDQFVLDVTNYKESLRSRQSIGSSRPTQTAALKKTDKKINTAAEKVKTYINEKYDTLAEAKAAYAGFGFVHKNRSYKFPVDHDKRVGALELMIAAIASNGFGSKPFGTTFWTDINEVFIAALGDTTATDKAVSEDVGDKNIYRDVVHKVLVSLLLIIEANYPDDYKQVKRAWGFLKENY